MQKAREEPEREKEKEREESRIERKGWREVTVAVEIIRKNGQEVAKPLTRE